MRLNPGISLDYADDVLRRAEMTWVNARGVGVDYFRAYIDAVHDTFPVIQQIFANPDLASGMRSAAYWSLLAHGGDARPQMGVITDPDVAANLQRALRASNGALATELDNQIKALQQARADLEVLKTLAKRIGMPVVYDTNMLNHWKQPDQILWRQIFKDQKEAVSLTRVIVPLRVVDELDKQKYGQGELARRAATAIRFLDRVLKDSKPGEQVELREGAVLEVWGDAEHRGGDADLSILLCASDLVALHGDVRVLTDDVGMRLRAQRMGLRTMRLPEDHRKPGTAMSE